jgi:hypothetical protein
LEREEEQLLWPRVATGVGIIGGEVDDQYDTARDWQGMTKRWRRARAREEEGREVTASGENEGERETTSQMDKRRRKWTPQKQPLWAESQLRFKVRHCRTSSLALSQSGIAAW